MDVFKRQANKDVGHGGWRCKNCNESKKLNRRAARKRLKRQLRKEYPTR